MLFWSVWTAGSDGWESRGRGGTARGGLAAVCGHPGVRESRCAAARLLPHIWHRGSTAGCYHLSSEVLYICPTSGNLSTQQQSCQHRRWCARPREPRREQPLVAVCTCLLCLLRSRRVLNLLASLPGEPAGISAAQRPRHASRELRDPALAPAPPRLWLLGSAEVGSVRSARVCSRISPPQPATASPAPPTCRVQQHGHGAVVLGRSRGAGGGGGRGRAVGQPCTCAAWASKVDLWFCRRANQHGCRGRRGGTSGRWGGGEAGHAETADVAAACTRPPVHRPRCLASKPPLPPPCAPHHASSGGATLTAVPPSRRCPHSRRCPRSPPKPRPSSPQTRRP